MATLRTEQVIECFHLAFLGAVSARVEPARYVLKGGANLRYYFDSIRYSEGIDIDVDAGLNRNLEPKVDGVLGSPPLLFVLRTCGLSLEGFTKPKQSDTTRRWKVAIAAPGHADPVRTKVEFASRGHRGGGVVEPVPERVVAPYGVRPPLVQHYDGPAALAQKVEALAGRSETQARDVFDLDLLLRRSSLPGVPRALRELAAEKCLELPPAAFSDQVVPFLDPDVAALYPASAWGPMQDFVAERLLA